MANSNQEAIEAITQHTFEVRVQGVNLANNRRFYIKVVAKS
jgi:hypothetical protein